MRSPDLTDVDRIERLLRGIPPESEREAQLEGLIRQLRGFDAEAPRALRERVRALEERPRRRWSWKPALVLVPVVALGLVAGVLVGRGNDRRQPELAGYVVSSSIGTHGSGGEARLTVRVPARRVQDAITRFGDLGTITAQNVDVQDRQSQLDAFARRIDSLRVQLAELNLKLAHPGLSTPERLRFELRRQRLQGLQALAPQLE